MFNKSPRPKLIHAETTPAPRGPRQAKVSFVCRESPVGVGCRSASRGHDSMDHLEEKRQRGKLFSEWLRKITADPRTGEQPKASSVARAVSLSSGRVGVLMGGAVEHDGRISLPKGDTIDRIATKYGADANEARVIVGLAPRQSAGNIFIPEIGARKFVLSTGDVLFSRPNDPDAARRAALVEAYLAGLQSGLEKRD